MPPERSEREKLSQAETPDSVRSDVLQFNRVGTNGFDSVSSEHGLADLHHQKVLRRVGKHGRTCEAAGCLIFRDTDQRKRRLRWRRRYEPDGRRGMSVRLNNGRCTLPERKRVAMRKLRCRRRLETFAQPAGVRLHFDGNRVGCRRIPRALDLRRRRLERRRRRGRQPRRQQAGEAAVGHGPSGRHVSSEDARQAVRDKLLLVANAPDDRTTERRFRPRNTVFGHAVVVRFAVHPVSSLVPSLDSAPASAIAIIPARYASTRLHGKALADIAGRPMIEHVYRRTSEARSISSVIVATDDERIQRAVTAFGGTAVLTSPHHPSGTDRLAEVAASLTCGIIVNVQGDEPLIEPALIDSAVEPLRADPVLEMSTLRRRLELPADVENPNITKVVVDREGYALYFSRASIPYVRNRAAGTAIWGHVGLYVYRRACLLRLASLAPTDLERSETLEQLRALEHGIRIKAIETTHEAIGVDTPEDLERVRRLVERQVLPT